MASNLKKVLTNTRTKHTVGNVTSYNAIVNVIDGAKVVEENGVDNYCLVEMSYSSTSKERECKYATASATTENVFITVTPETVLDKFGEKMCDFYNAEGELATLAYAKPGFAFQTSNVAPASGSESTAINVGDYVKWDVTTKKFVVCTPATSDIKIWQIRDIEDSERYSIDSMTLYELVTIR